MSSQDLPVAEFAFPGPLRDELVAAIVTGGKTTTTGLVADYENENEPVPRPGLRQAVVDSAGNPVAVMELTVRCCASAAWTWLMRWVTRNSPSTTTPSWWPRRSDW